MDFELYSSYFVYKAFRGTLAYMFFLFGLFRETFDKNCVFDINKIKSTPKTYETLLSLEFNICEIKIS